MSNRVTRWRLWCPVEQGWKYLSQQAYRSEVENTQWDFTCPTCGASVDDLDREWLKEGYRAWWTTATPDEQVDSQCATFGVNDDNSSAQGNGDGGSNASEGNTLTVADGDGFSLAPGSPGFCGPS